MRGLIFAEFLYGFSFYISFAWNRSIKVNEEITHCDTIHKLTAKTQKREDKKKNEEFSTKPCKTRSENMVEKQNPQERNFFVWKPTTLYSRFVFNKLKITLQ